MKRRIAMLLAVILVVCAGFTVYAVSGTAPSTEQGTGDSSGQTDAAEDGGLGAPAAPGGSTAGNADREEGPGAPIPGEGSEDNTVSGDGNDDILDTPTQSPTVEPAPPAEATASPQVTTAPPAGATASPQVTTAPPTVGPTSPAATTAPPMTTEAPTATPGGAVVGGAMGQVDVTIGSALTLYNSESFIVSLTNEAGQAQTQTIQLKEKEADRGSVSFAGLADGTYTLTVSGKGFATYSQSIQVQGKGYAVTLMTGFVNSKKIVYEEGGNHPGVLLVGDVNGDGRIDETDRAALVDAIEGRGTGAAAADLNGDGRVDLVDLEYFVKGYEGLSRHTTATVETFIPIAAITPAAGAGTTVSGNLADLLTGEGSVSLSPAGGGEISDANPVVIEFNVAMNAPAAGGIIIETGNNNQAGEGNSIDKAKIDIVYIDADGKEQTEEIYVNSGELELVAESRVTVMRDANGNLWVDLGGQIAVKKVTLTITGMKKNTNLAEISKVEFVNDMENRIPEPKMDIPEKLKAEAGSKSISLTWDPCVNVTGYEVEISEGGKTETVMVASNAYTVTSFGGKELVNYTTYTVRVQSVNGTWRSGYSEAVTAEPKPTKKPDKPDNVSASGGYKSIVVSWKKMKDTLSYNLFYKKAGEDSFQKIEGIKDRTSYTIFDLEDLEEYIVYLTGVNELGESGPSLQASARTTDLNPAVMPKYNLINVGGEGEKGAHIISAVTGYEMKESPFDTEKGTAWGTVDKNPTSHFYAATWDIGGFNNLGYNQGITYEFDQAYYMDTFAFYDLSSGDTGLSYLKVRYWDDTGKETFLDKGQCSFQRRTDANNKIYYVAKLPEPANVKKLQFGLARYSASGTITVAEVYFYYFDELTEEIMAIYGDDLHMTLKPEVTQKTIDDLRVKLNTIDPISGEYHPDLAVLEIELKNAEELLNNRKLGNVISVHSGITTRDAGRGFGGINAWQPLGVVAGAQEEIIVYVGHASKKTGESTELQLIATQYHSESSPMFASAGTLKVGANKITVPKIGSLSGVEGGGALYVQYSGSASASDQYAVRVGGGVRVPMLDLYRTSGEERMSRIRAYVEELSTFVGGIEGAHNQFHKGSENSQVNYGYDKGNCILGASDIMMDNMMLSLPAQQILAGLGSGSVGGMAEKLSDSLQAMEDMMYLFYQHKGLNSSAPEEKDQLPKGHLNIRYQRMFSGAFMYASGNHIGIEWGSATGMVTAKPVVADSSGMYQSGLYFGWGVAHEIGHCINQGAYAVAEVTNNYYSQLAQGKDTNESFRYNYDSIYERVTSNAKGSVHLAMYWQLHLAYDKGFNYKTYADYNEQLANLFFARVDTYARTPSKAPGGLKLAGDKEQDFMRLACAAAGKDILDFFRRWGLEPDEGTVAYASQFEKETRAIYYVCDDSRVYALTNGESGLSTDGTTEAVADTVKAAVVPGNANQVKIELGSKNIPSADVLGYEIVRCTVSGGDVEKAPVGFTTQSTFTDTVYMNNRMVWYEISVVDKYLNRSAAKRVDAVKIENDGSQEKAFWTIKTTNLTAKGETGGTSGNGTLCTPETEDPALLMIDGNAGTVYEGTAKATHPEILLEFNKNLTVAGFKYTSGDGTMPKYEIQVQTADGWKTAAKGNFADGIKGTVQGTVTLGEDQTEERTFNTSTIYFANDDQKYVGTYDTGAVKLILETASGAPVFISELDVLGATGDHVDFRREDGIPAIGELGADYRYGKNEGDVIPAGSVIFTGSYKGNPAYNSLILFDQDGNVVGGVDGDGHLKAQQIILADVPDTGNIQDVSEGTWIYWVEPDQNIDLEKITKVRAELYRVNNAETNEGQRLVSDTLFVDMPNELPKINFGSSAGN